MLTAGCHTVDMEGLDLLALILFLILVCVILGILGAVVHGLIWLLIVAVVLFVATLVFGGSQLRKRTHR